MIFNFIHVIFWLPLCVVLLLKKQNHGKTKHYKKNRWVLYPWIK